jgi:outer membrane protein assembly factor BamB
MKTLLGAVVTVVLIVTPARAQSRFRHYQFARVPAPQALARLNLQVAWRLYLPVVGRRDGIHSVQFAPKGQEVSEILVQTVSGVIVLLDGRDGRVKWKTRVGHRFRVTHQLAFNDKSVFCLQADHLYSIDRGTGKTEWTYILPSAGTNSPVASDDMVFLAMSPNRVYAYDLPDLEQLRRQWAAEDKKKEESGYQAPSLELYGGGSGIKLENLAQLRKARMPEPEEAWSFLLEAGRISHAPVLTAEALMFITENGIVYSNSRFSGSELFQFETDGKADAPLGQYGDMTYIGSANYNLYALNVPRRSIAWRFNCGAAVRLQPAVTDKDIFVVAERRGLYRVDRVRGREVWVNRAAHRFLAVNNKFVYAQDRYGRLTVLDYRRGTTLGMLDTRDFTFPVTNEHTNRLFLAGHNGLLVCLRDRARDQRRLRTLKKVIALKKRKKPEEKPKKEEKKDDQKKKKDDDEE